MPKVCVEFTGAREQRTEIALLILMWDVTLYVTQFCIFLVFSCKLLFHRLRVRVVPDLAEKVLLLTLANISVSFLLFRIFPAVMWCFTHI